MTFDGVYTYIYDAENRLTQAKDGATVLGDYEYDPLGRRSEKTVSGTTTEYLYSGAQVLAEYDGATGDLLRRYVYAPGIDDPLAILNEAGDVTYFHSDGLGSIIALSDDSGANIDIFTHGPFGEVDTNSGGSAYKYTARRIDEETGLYYYRNRYYHPEIGRFMSADPIGYGAGLNMYAYVGNDPMNYTDPSGLASRDYCTGSRIRRNSKDGCGPGISWPLYIICAEHCFGKNSHDPAAGAGGKGVTGAGGGGANGGGGGATAGCVSCTGNIPTIRVVGTRISSPTLGVAFDQFSEEIVVTGTRRNAFAACRITQSGFGRHCASIVTLDQVIIFQFSFQEGATEFDEQPLDLNDCDSVGRSGTSSLDCQAFTDTENAAGGVVFKLGLCDANANFDAALDFAIAESLTYLQGSYRFWSRNSNRAMSTPFFNAGFRIPDVPGALGLRVGCSE